MKKRTKFIIGGLMLVALGGGAAADAAMKDDPPPRIPGVRADGTVDINALPDSVPEADANGNPKKDANGKVIMHKVDKGPPPQRPTKEPEKTP